MASMKPERPDKDEKASARTRSALREVSYPILLLSSLSLSLSFVDRKLRGDGRPKCLKFDATCAAD